MITLVLQCAVALLTPAFGVLALRAARTVGSAGVHRSAWWLTGVVFTILGISTALHVVASLLVLASSTEGFVQVYVFIALVSTVASLILYTVCAGAALKLPAKALRASVDRRAKLENRLTASAVAMNEFAGTMTSSPGPTPAAR